VIHDNDKFEAERFFCFPPVLIAWCGDGRTAEQGWLQVLEVNRAGGEWPSRSRRRLQRVLTWNGAAVKGDDDDAPHSHSLFTVLPTTVNFSMGVPSSVSGFQSVSI